EAGAGRGRQGFAGLALYRPSQQRGPGRYRRDSENADKRRELSQRLRDVTGLDEEQSERQQSREGRYAEMSEYLIDSGLVAFILFWPPGLIAQYHGGTGAITKQGRDA